MSTFIKICGITRLQDARAAMRAGANAVGFIFAKSPRRISVSKAGSIASRLHPSIRKIGVFVNISAKSVLEAVDAAGLDGVQVNDQVEELRRARPGLFIAKVVRSPKDANQSEGADVVLIDPRDPSDPTRKSRPIPLDSLKSTKAGPLLVAGGLTPRNVGRLVSTVKPWGVDVSGGVEYSPGKKNPELIRSFVRAVRKAE